MSVDRAAVADMSKLIAMMNGSSEPEFVSEQAQPLPASTANLDPDTAVMKSILETLQRSTGRLEAAGDTAILSSSSDVDVHDAMMVEATESGVRVGDFQIVMKEVGRRRQYDVLHVQDGTVVAESLALYEAAYGIARDLAKGNPITTEVVRGLLRAEEDYARALHDAIHYRYTLEKRAITESRRAVVEDRYDEAKRRAARARAQVEALAGPLPF